MLIHLQIRNFAIIEYLELDFKRGLSVITGETGAGKSIVIDALSILLGERADYTSIRNGHDKCEIIATFEIQDIPKVQEWLKKQEYNDETATECIIRRIIHKEGKSRQMINGYQCTLQQLRDLVPLLINIHGQHQQQLLTKKHYQRELLDNFASHHELCAEINKIYLQWKQTQKELEELQLASQNGNAHLELLKYQIAEIEKLALNPYEYEQLDQEQKQLANASLFIKNCHETMKLLSESDAHSAQDILYQAQNYLQQVQNYNDKISQTNELLNHAILHLEEAISELRSFINQIEINPERLEFVEKRLSKIHELARKHHIQPQEIHSFYQHLTMKSEQLIKQSERFEVLEQNSVLLKNKYLSVAQALHINRQKAAEKLNIILTTEIQKLGMPGGNFKIQINYDENEMSSSGSDSIEFLISANPGQDEQPLSRVASGGELSRIALAIYVTTAQKNTTPILVFDEVDVGIGGNTAAIIGKLLHSLANKAQIICITHLPQVAAYGEHHFRVEKKIQDGTTQTTILSLGSEEKIKEIARMLGGITITEKTLAHARELLETN